jgi:diguanylate cyclase
MKLQSFFHEDQDSDSVAGLTRKSLLDTETRLGSVLNVLPIGLLIHTEQGILYANREAEVLLSMDKELLYGQHFMDFIRDEEADIANKAFFDSFQMDGKTVEIESVIKDVKGTEYVVRIIMGRLPWEGQPVVQVLFQDITNQKKAENSLRKLTITDELTGAYNRRHVLYEATLYLTDHQTSRVPVSVILIDIDHFKKINDTFGHAVGDLALKKLSSLAHDFAAKIAGCNSAIFARIGGEEFMFLLPAIETSRAALIAEQFRMAVEGMRISVSGENKTLTFTISSGVATFAPTDKTVDSLLIRADSALYLAKAEGRNRVNVHHLAKN